MSGYPLFESQLIPNIARGESAGLLPLKSALEPRSPRKFAPCGFSLLPSIIASPICTPSCSASSRDRNKLLITPGEPSGASLRVLVPRSTPTWIATPPTPPSKSVRRSSTIAAHRSIGKTVHPSTSFPASMSTHASRSGSFAGQTLKRSKSVPALFSNIGDCPIPASVMGAEMVQSPKAIFPSLNPFEASFANLEGSEIPALKRIDSYGGSHTIKALFRLSNDFSPSGDEDDDTVCNRIDECSIEDPSPAGSWSDHSVEDLLDAERHKDAFRRYHALKELLATEVGYLADLKALVTVYLRNLPTLAARSLTTSSTFGRASSSFTSGPWIHSYTQLQAAAVASSSNLPDAHHTISPGSSSAKDPSRSSSRYLFSDAELELLTRNAEELLQLHEHFVRELRILLEPLDISMQLDDEDRVNDHLPRLDAAIRAVSTKFATEASRFTAYQSFCTGHPEAIRVIRKASQQYPIELEAFEQRCATMVSDMVEVGSKPAASEPKPTLQPDCEVLPQEAQQLNVDDRRRAISSASLDAATRTLRPRPSILLNRDSVVFPTEPKRDKSSPRIAFTDYMIKPIQRICKYPLLLDQLLPSKALRTLTQNDSRSDVDVVVESAAQAMRHVAASVDEARHKQDIAMQSALIFARICIASSHGPNSSLVQVLTPEFFASLGTCLLSGSLDVIHYAPHRSLEQSSNIKARYFGAFLYKGGYLVLVKVSKGRKYEPKHWFSLIDFEVSDVEDEGSWLPCSFTLSCGDQHFELAAACQREKDAWLSAIHESLAHVPAWVREPTPSFRLDEKGDLLQRSEEDEQEAQSGLATIRSIPETGHTSDPELSEPLFASLRHGKSKKKRSKYDNTPGAKYDMPPPPSRRTSSPSVKSIFSPMASDQETVLIRRSSPAARHHVDLELQDVISQSVLTARSYAYSHEVELFQAPKTGFSRSNSGIGMARLSKHESVRVPRRRTAESLDSQSNKSAMPGGRRNRKKLSVASIDYDTSTASADSIISPDHSPPSSRTHSRIASHSSSSNLPILPSIEASDLPPVKPRSFVRNVKGMFQLRPVSPVSVMVTQPSQPSIPFSAPLSGQNTTPYNVLHRWTKDPFRRRARSVNDEPERTTNVILDDPGKRLHAVS
ncbi:Dbl homology domain-containing protein [Agrocybe pediades]|nr:Dbl homology domain-containing protein [Agrocybe pediades]